MRKNVILLLDPRGVVIQGGSDTISRHAEYFKALAKLGPISTPKFEIFSSSKDIDKKSG